MEEEQPEKVLFYLRISRKVFLFYYISSIIIFGLMLILYFKGISLNPWLRSIALALGLSSILIPEVSRALSDRYIITDTRLTIIQGFIRQKKKNLHFFAMGFIPDITIKQGVMQRLLNYGNVYVRGASGRKIQLRNIDNPQKYMTILENLMEHHRKIHKSAEAKRMKQ